MEHIIHCFVDSLRLVPLLFIIYLLIEYLEHKNNNFVHHLFAGTKKLGPIIGALFGTIPQCGFSVIAAELFSRRAITLGTLVAIFLATSDEAIPLMLAHPDKIKELLTVIGFKFIVAVIFGFLIDVIYTKREEYKNTCHGEHQHFHGNCESCDGGIVKSAIIHSVKIFLFIFLVNVILGYAAENISPLMAYITGKPVLQAALTSLFGIIPNCAASVVLTELYLAGNITIASLIGGLCTGAGVGLLVLFKMNRNLKQNLLIMAMIYFIGVFVGSLLGVVL